jgi:hypothetical protein
VVALVEEGVGEVTPRPLADLDLVLVLVLDVAG